MRVIMDACPTVPSEHAAKAWCCHLAETESYVYVHPLGDLLEHTFDPDGECVCGPTPELIQDGEGDDAWMWTHHSLDGREAKQ